VTEPLVLRYELACAADHAFDVWTQHLGAWWPKGHSASGDPATRVVLEPGVGGRIYERTSDGREIEWGRITMWDPPRRLHYSWHIASDPSEATDVELRFVDLAGGRSRLEIVHTGWDRLGADGSSRRDANTAGWQALVPAFASAVAASP